MYQPGRGSGPLLSDAGLDLVASCFSLWLRTRVGASSMPKPRVNLTGEPYLTDGLRLVCSREQQRALDQIDFLNWIAFRLSRPSVIAAISEFAVRRPTMRCRISRPSSRASRCCIAHASADRAQVINALLAIWPRSALRRHSREVIKELSAIVAEEGSRLPSDVQPA